MSLFDRAKDRAEEAAKKAKPLAEQLREKAKPLAANLKDRAEQAAKSAKDSAESFRDGLHGSDEPAGKPDTGKPTGTPPPAP
jgi:F0F1-type ATP synthase membrane subunit b/b'